VFLFPLRELDILGVFVTPASVLLLVALVPSVAFHYLTARLDLNRFVWNRPVFEVALYVVFYAAAVLTLRPG
jgi:hypothetical protein